MHDPATPALTRPEAVLALAACLPTQFRAGRWRGVDGCEWPAGSSTSAIFEER